MFYPLVCSVGGIRDGMECSGLPFAARPVTTALKREPPSADPFDEDGWRKAWQIKFKYGKSSNLSVWLIDRLTRSEGGRWINMEEGRFELEWIDTANAWYAERQRRSKSSQSTHLLYKALQAAFPNIAEESSEKNKHIFVRRSFKLPDELCEEVREIVVGTGTKRTAPRTVATLNLSPAGPASSESTGGVGGGGRSRYLVDNKAVVLPKAQYKVPDHLMKDFMSAVSSTQQDLDPAAAAPVTKLVSAWNLDIPTEAEASKVSSHHDELGSPPMSPSFLRGEGVPATRYSSSQEATFEQICEYAKQQLEIIHKWASDMSIFKGLSCYDQKALLTSTAPEILVFSICCFSVQNKCGADNLILDKDLVISRTDRQYELAIRNIVSFIMDTIVTPLKALQTDRYELSRLRRIILFNSTTKANYQSLKDPEEVRTIRRSEHTLLQKHTNGKPGRIGELLLLLPPLTTAGNLFIEHLHLEKLVGDTFENLVAAELLLAMGNG